MGSALRVMLAIQSRGCKILLSPALCVLSLASSPHPFISCHVSLSFLFEHAGLCWQRLNSDVGGCYDDSDEDDEDSDEYGFGAMHNEDTEEETSDDEDDEDDDEDEDEEEGQDEKEEEKEEEEEGVTKKEEVKAAEVAIPVPIVNENKHPSSPTLAFAGRSSMKGRDGSAAQNNAHRNRSVRFGESEAEPNSELQAQGEEERAEGHVAIPRPVGDAPAAVGSDKTNPEPDSATVGSDQTNRGGAEPVQQEKVVQPPESATSNASTTANTSSTKHTGENEEEGPQKHPGAGDRRTSGPIRVDSVVLPVKPGLIPRRPTQDKQESSFGPSGSQANRKLSTLRIPEDAESGG